MNFQRCLLHTYRFMLQLYPPAFRNRFAPEMLAIAETAEFAEWPLILGDTSVAIARCWIEGTHSATAEAEPNAYLAIGGSPLPAFGLIQGLVLSTVIILGLLYVGYRWPPPCPTKVSVVTHIVGPPQPSMRASK